jgi:hypothetical protein
MNFNAVEYYANGAVLATVGKSGAEQAMNVNIMSPACPTVKKRNNPRSPNPN